jgi:hypothetical protein
MMFYVFIMGYTPGCIDGIYFTAMIVKTVHLESGAARFQTDSVLLAYDLESRMAPSCSRVVYNFQRRFVEQFACSFAGEFNLCVQTGLKLMLLKIMLKLTPVLQRQ